MDDQQDKRGAAIHEAGHAAVLAELGGYGVARIWRNDSGAPSERGWLGRLEIYMLPKLPGWGPLVGVAGVAAECINEIKHYGARDDFFESEAEQIECMILARAMGPGLISESDMALMEHGRAVDFDVIAQAVAMLHKAWPAIERHADEMMVNAV